GDQGAVFPKARGRRPQQLAVFVQSADGRASIIQRPWNRPSGVWLTPARDDTPMPPARGTGTLMVGGQPPGSLVTNLSGVGMLREGRDPEVNGRAGSIAMSSPRAKLSAAFAGRAVFDAVASVVSFCST